MSETKTESIVVVKTSAKVIAAIREQVKAQSIALGKQAFTARTIRTEADRMGYDEKQARTMATLSWREARSFNATKEGEEKTASFDQSARPDIAKVMSLAYPVPTHAKDVEKAMDFNEKLGDQKHGRISSQKLLDISRGKLTFDDAKAGKSAPKASNGGTTPEPSKPVKLTKVSLENELAGIRARYCKPGILTPEQMREISDAVFCDGTYKPSTTKE